MLILMHDFSHLGFHETQPFALRILVDDAAYPFCILRSLPLLSRISSSCLSLFSSSSITLAAWRTHVPVCTLLPIVSSTGACRCMPLQLLCNRTPTCRALVVVRTLALANPGPPSLASPNMHKSATASLVPCMAMISTMHFILEFASGVNSCTKYCHCAACASYISHRNSMSSLSFFLYPLFRSLSDPMMTSGSLLPMVCLQFVMSSAPADEIDTQFNELFSMFATLSWFSHATRPMLLAW